MPTFTSFFLRQSDFFRWECEKVCHPGPGLSLFGSSWRELEKIEDARFDV